jgi:F-type H+-transporting ATPase subunit b
MLIGFAILFFILAKFAWPVITNGIAARNKKIADQLEEAAKIHEEMESLNKKHEEMMAQAKAERDALLAEARKVSEEMYDKAKQKATAESQAMIEDAKKAIYFEKMKAITDAKNAIANFSIDIAQKLINEELSDSEKQEKLVEKWMEDVHFN